MASKDFFSGGYFKECWMNRGGRARDCGGAFVALAVSAMPIPKGAFAPKKVSGLENSAHMVGPIQDLPLLEVPKARANSCGEGRLRSIPLRAWGRCVSSAAEILPIR